VSGSRGRALALSIGDAADREKLGFPEREVQRVLFTLCTGLVREGYSILYAGDLRPGGYTLAMFKFLAGTYAGQGVVPFTNVLPEPVVRRLGFEALLASARAAHGVAEIVLSIGGQLRTVRHIDGDLLIGEKGSNRASIRDEAQFSTWLKGFPAVTIADGFSQARQAVSHLVEGRVAMGGRMGIVGLASDQYEGALPGIAEEAILSLEAGKTFVPLAAFGGATRDVAIALGLLPAEARTPRGRQLPTYDEAMKRLEQLRGRLPKPQLARLRRLTTNDRAEDLTQEVLSVLKG
jgi:hypothetical protein